MSPEERPKMLRTLLGRVIWPTELRVRVSGYILSFLFKNNNDFNNYSIKILANVFKSVKVKVARLDKKERWLPLFGVSEVLLGEGFDGAEGVEAAYF